MEKRESFLIFGSPVIGEAEIAEVERTLRSCWLGTGPRVSEFESEFAAYKGGFGHPVAVSSGTAALHVSLIAAGLVPGDEVITTALTFCATVNAIIHAGLKPVLADVDPATMNLDPEDVKRKITPRTRALLPVHFAGRPCEMDALIEIAAAHGLKIIEDCAHAIETTYHGRPAGSFGEFGCFSFYVTKSVITGEGGMILAREQAAADRCKVLALHGMSHDAWARFSDHGYRHYEVVECGFKYNMTDLQASIGIHQLRSVEKRWERRREIWSAYNEAFCSMPMTVPKDPALNTRHAYHLYTVVLHDDPEGIGRDRFLGAMTDRQIGVGVHYRSIPEHAYYRERFGWRAEDYPHAMKIGRQTVSLPLSAKLTPKDVSDVINAVGDCLS